MSAQQIPLDLTTPDVRAGTHAAFRRTDTSRDAAVAVTRDLGARQKAVLDAIRERPSTIHEIATKLHIPDHSASARVRELTIRKLIEATTQRRKNDSGHSAIVWVAV